MDFVSGRKAISRNRNLYTRNTDELFRMNLSVERYQRTKISHSKIFDVADHSHFEEENIDDVESETFHTSITPVLVVAQCFGIMPVVEITNAVVSNVNFEWRAYRILFTVCYFILAALCNLFYIRFISKSGINAKNIVGCVFFTICFVCNLFFFILAQNWRKLIMKWTESEKVFLKHPYKVIGWRLSTKIRATATLLLLLAAVEHGLFLLSSVHNQNMQVKICNLHYDDPWKHFFVNNYAHIFNAIPYHFVITVVVEVTNIMLTFGWNYMDIFIIAVSIGLSTRFEQINYRLKSAKGKFMDEMFWHNIRTNFVQLAELVEIVDSHLSNIILLTSINNLYFICFQLLNIYQTLPYLINYIYFWFSLLYLLGRSTCMYMMASKINDSAKKPLEILKSVPLDGYCSDIDRFITQVRTETIALTGRNFFYLTRKMLFGMAGTIVTYELVLLQFDEGTKTTGNATVCEHS